MHLRYPDFLANFPLSHLFGESELKDSSLTGWERAHQRRDACSLLRGLERFIDMTDFLIRRLLIPVGARTVE